MIHIFDEVSGQEEMTVEKMAGLAPEHFDISERVPGAKGKAFDFMTWVRAWRESREAADAGKRGTAVQRSYMPGGMGSLNRVNYTHIKVRAADEFEALIPWSQLPKAAFLYEQDGRPLQKGYPIRLYVPDGSSACLNVKSVIALYLLHDPQLGGEAVYGYRNQLSANDLKKKPL